MKPEVRDIARFLQGELTDTAAIRRLFKAIESDPVLAAAAELLSDDLELSNQADQETSRFVAEQLARFRDEPLWRIRSIVDEFDREQSPIRQLLRGSAVESTVDCGSGDQSAEMPIILTPDASGTSCSVRADWPGEFEPTGIVLAELDFAQGRKRFSEEVKLPRTLRPTPSVRADEGMSSYRPVTASADATFEIPHRDFSAHIVDARKVLVEAAIPEDCDEEVVVLEIRVKRNGRVSDSFVHCLLLPRESAAIARREFDLNELIPESDRSRSIELVVRPLETSDVPLLEGEPLTWLLANQEVVAIPLTSAGGVYEFELPRNDVNIESMAAFVRVAPARKQVPAC